MVAVCDIWTDPHPTIGVPGRSTFQQETHKIRGY
jgi:hypothetical protein